MKRIQLIFIFCVMSTVVRSIQGSWKPFENLLSEFTTYPPSDGKSWKKVINPNPSPAPHFPVNYCIDGAGMLFREYLEQERNFLQNRLNYISSLISKSYHNPCIIYPIHPQPPFPDHRPDFPYVDYNQFANNIVIDKSSGKNLQITLNLTDFTENDIKFEIIESRIVVEAQQQAEPHKYVKWTYLLPIGTNPSTIKHYFDNGYMTIEGTLSKDVNSFSSQQTIKTSIKHKTSTSFTHVHNYPHVFSNGKSWYHAKK